MLEGFVGFGSSTMALALTKVVGLFGVTAVAAEGTLLLGARSMAAIQGKVASAVKYVFLALALATAVAATTSLGLVAIVGTAHLFPCSTVLPPLAGFGVAAGTVPLHYWAFQWTKLI